MRLTLKLRGMMFIYTAVDKFGDTMDFMLSKKCDKEAAFCFFQKAIGQHSFPGKVTMNKSGANKAGIDGMNFLRTLIFLLTDIFYQMIFRQIQYLNNGIEQDHRGIKRITKPMMEFKSFASAEATIVGIELYCILRKAQHQDIVNLPVYKQLNKLFLTKLTKILLITNEG